MGGQDKYVWNTKRLIRCLWMNTILLEHKECEGRFGINYGPSKSPLKLVFLWKICNNCLPVRAEIHRRIQEIPTSCPMCSIDEESLEYLFFRCHFARAIWFGIDLSIRTDELTLYSVKDSIQKWLLKPELTKPKAFWFYGQFVCTLWCLWIP